MKKLNDELFIIYYDEQQLSNTLTITLSNNCKRYFSIQRSYTTYSTALSRIMKCKRNCINNKYYGILDTEEDKKIKEPIIDKEFSKIKIVRFVPESSNNKIKQSTKGK